MGVYVDGTLTCADATGVSGSEVAAPAGPDPIAAAQALLTGLRPSDELIRVGYQGWKSDASVGVRRDGEFVAILRLEPSDGGWGWSGFESCPDTRISY